MLSQSYLQISIARKMEVDAFDGEKTSFNDMLGKIKDEQDGDGKIETAMKANGWEDALTVVVSVHRV